MANKTQNIEPLMAQEKITNDDGTPSDYLIRYLRTAINNGDKSIKFPVTSVNGKTGDVILDIEDIISNFDIDYDKLNEKLQELIAGLDAIRQEMILKFQQHITDYHKYAFQGFTVKSFGDERLATLPSTKQVIISTLTGTTTVATCTTATAHGMSTGNQVQISNVYKGAAGTDKSTVYNGTKTITVTSPTQFTYEITNPLSESAVGQSMSGFVTYPMICKLDSNDVLGSGAIYTPNKCVTSGYQYPSTHGGLVMADKGCRSFCLFNVERTIKASRIYISVGSAGGAITANDTSPDYAQHEFAIYKASIIQANNINTANLAYPIKMRFPGGKIWGSEVLSTESILSWPNVAARADGATNFIPTLSWDADIVIERGVYFLALNSFYHGTGGSAINAGIKFLAANTANLTSSYNTDGSQSFGIFMEQALPSNQYREYYVLPASIGSGYANLTSMTFYDWQTRTAAVKPNVLYPLPDSFTSAISDQQPPWIVSSATGGFGVPYYFFVDPDTGIVQNSVFNHTHLGGVSFSCAINDYEPHDTW